MVFLGNIYVLWITIYNKNHRNPSKHRIEEHDMLNRIKHQRKLLNAGQLKSERVEVFEGLLALVEQYRRVNQYQ